MTKEQFLSGTVFKVVGPTYKGAETYSYNQKDNYMTRQVRSSIDERVILDDYLCNVLKVGRLGFVGFTHIMRKKVIVKYRFSDLIPYQSEVPVGE
jgi:hypothetical protein